MFDLTSLCEKSKKVTGILGSLSERKINECLKKVADDFLVNADYILAENQKDIENATSKNYPTSLLDRLRLTNERLQAMAVGVRQIAQLESPIGKKIYSYVGQDGINISQIKVPFGVIGIIFESRPNVTADAFALCFKTQNAVILRGGSDAINSNKAIVKSIKQSLTSCGVSSDAIGLIEDTSREVSSQFMKMDEFVDLLIPRGGAGLIKSVYENSTIPVIVTGTGNCHIYVDESANLDMAANVIFNAKTQRYGVCNACESLVINSKVLKDALVKIKEKLDAKGVVIRGDERANAVICGIEKATEEDFATEYLNPIISVKTVDSLDEAIEHVNKYSTKHSECIITENAENAEKFMRLVDASTVYHNVSTRFTDGFEFGFGAEIGISTQKLHARGPMGLDALTTTKFIVTGNGQTRK